MSIYIVKSYACPVILFGFFLLRELHHENSALFPMMPIHVPYAIAAQHLFFQAN